MRTLNNTFNQFKEQLDYFFDNSKVNIVSNCIYVNNEDDKEYRIRQTNKQLYTVKDMATSDLYIHMPWDAVVNMINVKH